MKKFVGYLIAAILVLSMVFAMAACGGDETSGAKLKAIAVTTKPTKTEYIAGDTFDPTGMVVMAAYDDNTTKPITGYTIDKTGALTVDDPSVKISYTEGNTTKTVSLSIIVNPGIDHQRYHDFDASTGKCSCGAVKFELEDSTASGDPTGDDTFIVQNELASGGKCIGNWREGNNMLTFYATTTAAINNVALGLRFAPVSSHNATYTLPTTSAEASRAAKQASGDMWAFEMRVNDTIISWQDGSIPLYGGTSYFDWITKLSNGIDLIAGENKIEIEAWDFYGMNLDYMFINVATTDTVTISGTKSGEEPVPVHTHDFNATTGKCACGALKLEAENFEATGEITTWAKEDANPSFYRDDNSASNKKKIGAWGANADNKLTMRLTAAAAYADVKLVFRISTGELAGAAAGFDLYFEGAKDAKIAHANVSGARNTWRNLSTDAFTLAAGDNILIVEALGNNEIDFDYVIIEDLPKNASITIKEAEADEPAPVHTHSFTEGKCACGALKIEAETCETAGDPAYGGSFYRDDPSASGGKKIGAWGDNGNSRVFIKLDSDATYSNVTVTFRLCTGNIANPDKKAFFFYFNGDSGNEIGHGNLSNNMPWTDLVSNEFTLKAGLNYLVLDPYQGSQIDWDYFIINGLPTTAVVTPHTHTYVDGKCSCGAEDPDYEAPHAHDYADGKCTCGALKIEAETCETAGDPAYGGSFYRDDDSASGGKKIGAWGDNGNSRVWIKFTSDEAYENVTMTFCIQTGTINNSEAFLFYFNDDSDNKITHGSLSGGTNVWTNITSASFNVKKGENFLVLDPYVGNQVDFDYFILEGLPAGAVISVASIA